MSKMIIMQGLPGSGKTTRAKELMAAEGNVVHLNKDLLRTMLHFDKFTGVNESATRTAARVLAKTFLTQHQNVIIDDTNLNPSTLQGWKDLAKECGAKIQYEVMDTSVEECIARDELREKPVGRDVIVQMALQYQDYLKGHPVVICDLDGTLCDIEHRLKYVQVSEGEKKDWKSFFRDIPNDTVRTDILDKLMDFEQRGNKIIFVSARPDTYRRETEAWLEKVLGGYSLHTALIMRSSRDTRDDTEVKSDIYEKYLRHLSITKVFDDRPKVIRMWREKGLEVEDCGAGVEF